MHRRIHISVESIMVILLMILLSISISILIYNGSLTYRNIIDNKTEEENIRIALSYVNMRVKQNDLSGNITIDDSILQGQNVLAIYHHDEEEGLMSYIYYLDGYLWECYTDTGFDHTLSTSIIPIDGIDFTMEDHEYLVTSVDFRNTDHYIPLTQLTVLRTRPPE